MSISQYEECQNYMVHGKPHYEGQLTLDCRAKKVANKDENEGKAGPLRKTHSSYHISQDQRNKWSTDCAPHHWDLDFQTLSVFWVKISFEHILVKTVWELRQSHCCSTQICWMLPLEGRVKLLLGVHCSSWQPHRDFSDADWSISNGA